MIGSRLLFFGLAASLLAVPAMADVKAGTDAWNRGDYGTAVKEWRQSAINGNAEAQFNLGQAYKLGRGVAADPKQAGDWFLKAALQGNVQNRAPSICLEQRSSTETLSRRTGHSPMHS